MKNISGFMSKHYEGTTFEQQEKLAIEANKSINSGYRIVFKYNKYWKGPVFQIQRLVPVVPVQIQNKIQNVLAILGLFDSRKVLIWEDVKDENYDGYNSKFINSFNPDYLKDRIIPSFI